MKIEMCRYYVWFDYARCTNPHKHMAIIPGWRCHIERPECHCYEPSETFDLPVDRADNEPLEPLEQ